MLASELTHLSGFQKQAAQAGIWLLIEDRAPTTGLQVIWLHHSQDMFYPPLQTDQADLLLNQVLLIIPPPEQEHTQ